MWIHLAFSAEDLDRIPGLPPHTELVDGRLFFRAPQRVFHSVGIDLLETCLRRTCPPDLRVRREMNIRIGPRQRPEPDIIVVREDAVLSMDQTWFPAETVVLAVEVVSPDSAERDRDRKPQLYARAGIKHFWRLEQAEGVGPVLYVFELEPMSKTYAATGIFHDLVKLTVPYEIEIDLTEIYRL